MAVSPRLIRRRIKSVSNTKKITKAMELVAASKMRRAVSSVLASRPYAQAVWRAVGVLAGESDTQHPLLVAKDGPRTLLVFFASDRGLCGGYNAQATRAATQFIAGRNKPVDVICVGKKAADFARRRNLNVIAAFDGLTNAPSFSDVRPAAKLAVDEYLRGSYDEVHLCYTDFRSALVQKATVRRLLPLGSADDLGDVQGTAPATAQPMNRDAADTLTFEPSPDAALDAIIPRIVESQVWQALLESAASEHSARMLAMRSATDNAEEMIGWLQLTYNQARQANITREIAEISAGKAALE
jgi:F-type H+-transporting ATPase subunit gamma